MREGRTYKNFSISEVLTVGASEMHPIQYMIIMIIIPDIHGRHFWKDAVAKRKDGEMVVFLGDYLDPHEKPINRESFRKSFENLQDIVDFKKANEDTCILLFGNHELSYLFGWWLTYPHNLRRHFQYKRFLKENISNFKLIHATTIGNSRLLFSHAGIHLKWLERILKKNDSIEKKISYLQDVSVLKIKRALHTTTTESEFFKKWGSCVWLYVDDWWPNYKSLFFDNYYQVFGHTFRGEGNELITEYFAALDSCQAFRIDEFGVLERL